MVQWWAIYVTVSIVCFSSVTFRLSTHRMVPPVMGYAPIDRPAQVTGDENLGRRVVCACAAGRERSASHLTARRARTPRTTRAEARRRVPSVFGVGAAAAPARAGSDPFRRARDCSRCFARRRARLAARVTARRNARRPRRAKPPPRARRGAPPIDRVRAPFPRDAPPPTTRHPSRRAERPDSPRSVTQPDPRPRPALAPSLFPESRVSPTRASPRPTLRPAAPSRGRASPSPTPRRRR